MKRNIVIVFFCLLILPYHAHGAYPDSASLIGYTHFHLSDPGGTRISVRDSQGDIHVVYGYNWYGGLYADSSEIFYAYSTDNGITWSSMMNVSRTDSAGSLEPSLAIDSEDNLHCVWKQYEPGSGYDIYYSKYDGISWSGPQNISQQHSGSNTADYPAIVVDSRDYIHVVWDHYLWSGAYAIYYSYYNDTVWSTPYMVSPDSGDDAYPSLEVDSEDSLHLCWRRHGLGSIIYTSYDGVSWSPYDTIAIPGGLAYHPCIVVDSQNNPKITCMGGASIDSLDIYYVGYDGVEWSSPLNLSNSSVRSANASLAIDSLDNLYVVWCEDVIMVKPDIYYTDYNGVTWSPVTNITNDTMRSWNPKLGNPVKGDKIDLVWMSEFIWPTLFEVLYLGSKLVGTIGEESMALTQNAPVLTSSPNPFSDRTEIRYQISHDTKTIDLRIYDVCGRLVKTFRHNSAIPNLQHTIYWDGYDNSDGRVSQGVYFVKLDVDHYSVAKKLLKIK